MSAETQSLGFDISMVTGGVPVTIQASYNTTSLFIKVLSCKLDLAKTVRERFNDLNIVLPPGSDKLMIAQFSGSISKTDAQKALNPAGAYRLISFMGEMENITIPLPVVSDISIDKAYFSYQYLSASSSATNTNFSDQVVFLGCRISVKPGTDLSTALTGATLSGAYFLSNNASIIYFAFSGQINVGNIIKAVFGVSATDFNLNVQSSGIFQVAKKTTSSADSGKTDDSSTASPPPASTPAQTYLDALNQIAALQGKAANPDSGSDTGKLLPKTFPLVQKQVMVDGKALTKTGIQAGSIIDTDFTDQFNAAFTGDNVSGLCFWVIINFNQISLFNSLITIGYSKEQINSLILYGFKTQNKDNSTPVSAAYFFAQLPTIKLFDFLTLGGLDGRQGILFKYTSNSAGKQYELNGSISFTAFSKNFVFGGDLTVNDNQLTALLNVTINSPNSISEPLGMTGINFANIYFYVRRIFAKPATDGKPEIKAQQNIAIGGYINFNFAGKKLQMVGNVVFDNSEARLVLVSLDAQPALTLSDFVSQVIGKSWVWLDDVTRQIGFISGTMYYLQKPDSEKDNNNYTFTYNAPIQLKDTAGSTVPNYVTQFSPGYHIHANLLLFEKYVFLIDLSVETGGIALSGAYGGTYNSGSVISSNTINAYFISLQSPVLQISTVNCTSFNIQISHITLFNTDLGSITVGYNSGTFTGSYDHSSPSFGFEWKWTKQGQGTGGFSITKINGISTRELDALAQIVSKLNDMTGGGCSAVTNDLFGQFKSTFSPSLQQGQSPKDNGNGTMNTPITIDYNFSVAGSSIVSSKINLTLDVSVPSSIGNLPDAIFDTLSTNMGPIIEQVLKQPGIYNAIALQMAKKGFASLAAKMLCREANTAEGAELAESLEAAMEAGEITAELGAILELEGIMTGIFAAGIAVAVGGLLDILKKVWDAIKKFFTGDSGKDEAQDKLNKIKGPVQNLVNSINARLQNVANTIQISQLLVSVDTNGNYVASWNFPQNPNLGSNGNLNYQLLFLGGDPGNSAETRSAFQPMNGFTLMNSTSYSIPWNSVIAKDPTFRMNASIQTSITGYTFMTSDAEQNLQGTINTLNQIGNSLDGAVDFNNQLKQFVANMQSYNKNGLTSKVVYASLGGANKFSVGQSILGLNTKI